MHIVITGASRGIGLETLRILLEQTHKVIALARSSDFVQDLSCFPNFRFLSADLCTTTWEKPLQDLIAQFFDQEVHILINNAGAILNKPFEHISPGEIRQVYQTNVEGPFRLMQCVLPNMAAGAHIVNIGSMGGITGSAKFAGLSAYSSSKGALAIMGECLAEELKPRQIAVNTLALGAVQTEMLQEAFPGYQTPMQPHEMAAYIVDFALHGNRWFNGKTLPVSSSTP